MCLKLLVDDGMQIELGTGIGKYSKSIYEALDRRDDVQVDLVSWRPNSSNRTINRIEYLRHINSRQYRDLAENYDAVLYTNYAIPFRKMPCKVVCCIPDMVSFLYPETLPAPYRLYNKFMIKNSVKNANHILTISRSVMNELVTEFPNQLHKISYTWLGLYEGIGKLEKFIPYSNANLASLTKRQFFLFVSTVEKRKNVGLVLEAFLEFKKRASVSNYKIVFAGKIGFGGDEYTEMARQSAFAEDIIFTGYVNDNDLNRLYNEACAFIFPTIYEGFGFAQIECMSVSLPIILSDIPTNREISRDYGIFFDLGDVGSLTNALEQVANDKIDRNHLEELAKGYLPDFNWDKIAEEYVQIIVSGQNQ